jgi:hypothetical protein
MEQILEYKIGQKVFGASYVQRLGTPGNYIYIYPPKKFSNFGRRTKQAYARFVKKSKRFLKKVALRYEATSINMKPKSWAAAVIDIHKKNGDVIQMHVNLKNHNVYSYRSRRGHVGGAAQNLSKSKRKGILRYR